MKSILLVFLLFLCITSCAQIENCSFENWDTITGFGQAYEVPFDWRTNNTLLTDGFAATPVTKLATSQGFAARIESNSPGIDGVGSGYLSQTISLSNIESISYMSQCDSVFEKGSCIVTISTKEDLVLYADSIGIKENEWQPRIIEIPISWKNEYDSININFIAYGNYFANEPEENLAYSVFLIDEVKSELISDTNEAFDDMVVHLYPNPSHTKLNIKCSDYERLTNLKIYSALGELILSTSYQEIIDISQFPHGIYFIVLEAKFESSCIMFIKN